MALIRNLPQIKLLPKYGKLIVEAFQDAQKQLNNVSGQTNANLQGSENSPPPAISHLHVDGGAGIYHLYITDNSPNLYRGVEYTAEYSNDNWQTFHVEHLGPSRDKRLNLGIPGPLQWRAYSGYGPASPPSPAVYFGGQATPTPVYGSGRSAPALRPGQGSGTNTPTQPAGGYGSQPWRGAVPPVRS